MLDVENERIMEKNNQLELEKEVLIEDGNNKVSAMGQDMGNLIHKHKIFRRKYKKKNISSKYEGSGYGNEFKTKKAPTKVIRKNKHLKRKNRALNNYSRWKRIHKGSGVKKKFFKTKAPTTLKVGRAGPLAPSTISIFNNGEVHYRGEKGVHFKSAEFLQRNRGIGGMLKIM